nr:MAG TPA: hypothetical protein [Caudoviricetes sp.]
MFFVLPHPKNKVPTTNKLKKIEIIFFIHPPYYFINFN